MPDAPPHRSQSPRHDLEQELRSRFGFSEFRTGQRQVIEAVLDDRDVLAVMPTGQGKSLCFQLPAVLGHGLTVVVAPLIALMKDQVDGLRARGMPAAAFHSGLTDFQRDKAVQDLRLGRLRLLYLAPERMQHDWFVRVLRGAGVTRLVVDEAHCISRWGHDFRPDYLRLDEFRRLLGSPPCLALTATATVNVQADICEKLELMAPLRVVTGFRRPNLSFGVEPCPSKAEKLRALQRLLKGLVAPSPCPLPITRCIGKSNGSPGSGGGEGETSNSGSALIYCATRRTVEEVATGLAKQRQDVGYYHAGLEDELRAGIHQKFTEGRLRVLVATNAFGMGIDKPDVRLVVHYDVPGSLEAYYQEAGRAGRDGQPSRCVLLYRRSDVGTQDYFIQQAEAARSQAQRHGAELRALLQAMVGYAESAGCRQLTVLEYFGDQDEAALGPCGQCDQCVAGPVTEQPDAHVIEAARTALSAAARYHGQFGVTKMADLLYGSTGKALLASGLHLSTFFGKFRDMERRWTKVEITALLRRLIRTGYLQTAGFDFPVVELTTKGADVLGDIHPLQWDSIPSAVLNNRLT